MEFLKLKLRRTCKRILQFLTVFSVSCSSLFVICYLRFPIQWYYILPACIFIALGISIAASYSKTVRCVLALSLVKLAGPQSRHIFKTIITGTIICGPLVSIVYNLHEVNRTVNCTTGIVKSQFEEIQKAYRQAYKDISKILKESVSIFVEIGDVTKSVIEPIKKNFEVFNRDVHRMKQDCESTLEKAGNECNDAIDKVYRGCREIVPSMEDTVVRPVVGTLEKSVDEIKKAFLSIFRRRRYADPKDLQNVCRVFDTNLLCAPLRNWSLCSAIDIPTKLPSLTLSGIGKLFNQFRLSVNPTRKSDVKLKSDVGNMTKVAKEIRNNINKNFKHLKSTFRIAKQVLTLLLFAVPLMSYLYLRRYHKATRNGRTKKFFKKDSRKEAKKIVTQLVFTLAHMLFALFVFGFDYLLFATQNVARTHGEATFHASGFIDVDMNIRAGPVFQPMVDNFGKALRTNQSYQVNVSTYQCLPKPVPSTELSDIYTVAGLYIIVLASYVLQLFTGRLKQNIVQRFYPVAVTHNPTAKKTQQFAAVQNIANDVENCICKKRIGPTSYSQNTNESS